MNNGQNDKVNPVQIQKFLSVDYPADKQKLINHAREEGADENVISTLEKLPDMTFNSPVEVSEAISNIE